jgi:hypothetical protein
MYVINYLAKNFGSKPLVIIWSAGAGVSSGDVKNGNMIHSSYSHSCIVPGVDLPPLSCA